VACPKEVWHGQAGDGAVTVPIIEEAGAEDVLPYPLHNQSLGLGAPWQRGGLLRELVQQFVG
jgi:hypothetical protein